MAIDAKYGVVKVEVDSPNSPLNGSQEPVFVIRARDKTALLAIQAYADLNSMNKELYDGVGEVYDTFVKWRDEHPELVKMPD